MKIKISESELKEIRAWYNHTVSTIFGYEHLDSYKPGDADYERGIRDAIEDMAKKLGIWEAILYGESKGFEGEDPFDEEYMGLEKALEREATAEFEYYNNEYEII